MMVKTALLLVSLFAIAFIYSCRDEGSVDYSDWKTYRGNDGISAYSGLKEIDTGNVSQLQVAWTFHTGDNIGNSSIQCNPLIIDGIFYGVSPRQKVFALDARTGRQLWLFDPYPGNDTYSGVTRGLTWHEQGDKKRIFYSAWYKLFCLVASTFFPFFFIVTSIGGEGRS